MATQIDTGSVTWRLTPDLLGILDNTGVFRHTNPAWQKTLGWLPEEIESRRFLEFIHPDDIPAAQEAFVDLQTGKPILKFENRYHHKDGGYRWLSWNCVPDEKLFFCSARDVTDEKENQAALKTRDAEAKFREQFIAVLGHDLRNPITAIGAALRLIGREPQTDKARGYMEATQQSLDRMINLVDDVMDFARARLGGGLEIAVDDNVLVQPALEQVVEEVRLGNPSIAIIEDFRFNDSFRCDPDRIAQLLSNLLSNAITHGNNDKPVDVTTYEDNGNFVLSVANVGEPIPEAAMEMLFQPFTRSDVRESQHGLGLGLFIANEIARGHRGSLTVSSDLEGTEFNFVMPLTLADGRKTDI